MLDTRYVLIEKSSQYIMFLAKSLLLIHDRHYTSICWR